MCNRKSCHNLEYLNISNRTEFSKISIVMLFVLAQSFSILAEIIDTTIKEIACSCLNLEGCCKISKEAVECRSSFNNPNIPS